MKDENEKTNKMEKELKISELIDMTKQWSFLSN